LRILIFGPNGSGKGTQSAKLVEAMELAHVESGGIFRDHARLGTELGKEAKTYTDKGELVPDEITIPMILDRLAKPDCEAGWILDGFPRNPSQAEALLAGLETAGTPLDAVIEIELAREIAKKRLMGRCTCPNGHPNNTAIPAIQPHGTDDRLVCWKCGSRVTVRKDDIDEHAINLRLDIYFDAEEGTTGAIKLLRRESAKGKFLYVDVDGEGSIDEVAEIIKDQIKTLVH